MGKAAQILSKIIQIISPIPLLCFTIYMIIASSDGLWVKSNGAAILIVSIIVALTTIFSLSIIIITILMSKPNDSSNVNKIFQFSIFLTGICVFIATIYSSYKKELEARFLTNEYLISVNGSAEAESFNSSYPTNIDKDSFYHNRTLFIHDVIILLYALELLLYFISDKFTNDIVSFFKENDFTEEVDIESAPAKQKNILNPLEIDQESKSEENSNANKMQGDEKKDEKQDLDKDKMNNNNDNDKLTNENQLINLNNQEDKKDNGEEPKTEEKTEESPTKSTTDISKEKDENDKNIQDNKEQNQTESQRNNLAKTEKPNKKPFKLFSDSDSLEGDYDLFLSKQTNRNSPSSRRNKSSTMSPGSTRKRGRNYEQKSSDDSLEITTSSPSSRRTRRITMNKKDNTSPFGFSFDSNETSTDSLFNNNWASKTSPVKIDSNRPLSARRTRAYKGKSPFGFDMSDSESTDDILKDLY